MKKDYDLKDSRKQYVAKDNRLIQKSRSALSAIENKAILYLISKIKPDDTPGRIYEFDCQEFQGLLKLKHSNDYGRIKSMLKDLADRSWWIEDEVNGVRKYILLRWFDVVRIEPRSGKVEISFQTDMFPYLYDLKKHLDEDGQYYTAYRLQNIVLMNNKYSPRLYELLKSYQFNNDSWTFENGTGSEYDIQIRLADASLESGKELISIIPESWSNWAVFKRNVLEPAVKEINLYSDIKVEYEGLKEDLHHVKTRSVKSIRFTMTEKTDEEKEETENLIDSNFEKIDKKTSKKKKAAKKEKTEDVKVEELTFPDGRVVELKWEPYILSEEESTEDFEPIKEAEDETKINTEIESKLEVQEDAPEESSMESSSKSASHSEYPILCECLNDGLNAGFDEKKIVLLHRTAVRNYIEELDPHCVELFSTDLVTYYYDKIAATPEETRQSLFGRLLDCVKNDYDNEAERLVRRWGKDWRKRRPRRKQEEK